MATRQRCSCSRCAVRGMMGPAIITALGVLFLLSEVWGGAVSFENTYPLLFIVIGGILFASALAPMDGHISEQPPVPPVMPPPPTNPPTYSAPYPGQGQ